MSSKTIAIVSVSLAVICAAVAAVVVSTRRADEAKALAEREIAIEHLAATTNKIAQANRDAKRAEERAAEANEKAKVAELAEAEANERAKADEAAAAADAKVAAEAKASEERAKADSLRAIRDTAKLTNETVRLEQQRAKDLAAAAKARADVEASKLAAEKLKADRVIAERRVLELRKIDFETLEHALLEWKLDLEERERALKPEKTVADLTWAGGMEDSVIDENGVVRKKVKVAYDPEKDKSLTEQTRALLRTSRKIREAQDAKTDDTRRTVVRSMEALYVAALKDGRVIDADFYRKSILSMYPDWKFAGEKK